MSEAMDLNWDGAEKVIVIAQRYKCLPITPFQLAREYLYTASGLSPEQFVQKILELQGREENAA